MTSHYDILGISRTASDDEVKSAYIKKAKIFHPNVMKNNNLNNVSDSDMEFKKINEAYNILGNPAIRKLYDQGISGDALNSAANNATPENSGRRYGRRGNMQTKFHTKTDKYASINVKASNQYYKKFVETRGDVGGMASPTASNSGGGQSSFSGGGGGGGGFSTNNSGANVNNLGRKVQRQKTRLNFLVVGIPFLMFAGYKYFDNNSKSNRRRY